MDTYKPSKNIAFVKHIYRRCRQLGTDHIRPICHHMQHKDIHSYTPHAKIPHVERLVHTGAFNKG